MAAADLTLCPDCGRSIPRDAVRGLCMVCMTQSVFDEGGTEGTSRTPGESLLSLESLPSFGLWQVLAKAGEGAFGLVYEASQEKPIHRRAALKVLKPGLDSREVLARFAAEREALAVLDHPGIARVLDAGEEEGRPWFAAEWVDGARSVTEFCKVKSLTLTERVRLFQTICEAVAHAHQRGIIHRDLKPSNILVSADGAAKVIDFGIARATEQVLAQSTLVTLAGQVLGTPAYMSPEQAAGRGAEADTRSDIYSLGAVLYELLAGAPPFPRARLESVSLHEALRIVCEEAPAKPSALKPELRGELEWITLKALEKDPARRYETAAALARDLGHWLDGSPVLAAPPSRAYQLRTFLRRHRTATIGAAAVFIALLVGLAGTTFMFLRARENSERAVQNEAAARRNASRGDHQTAQTFFDKGEPVTAVMHLARAVRTDPTNHAAAERLLAELVWTDFPRLAHPPIALPQFIRAMGFSPDGSRLAVLCHEVNFAAGMVALFDVSNGTRLGEATLHNNGVHNFAFSPDSKTLALGHRGGAVTFWNAADGSPDPTHPVLVHQSPVRHLVWITVDRLTTTEDTGDKTSSGRLWDLSSQKVLAETKPVQALAAPAISPDRTIIAWVQYDGTVSILKTETGAEISTWKTPGHGGAAFVGGAELLAVQTFHEKLRLYHVQDGLPSGEPMQSSNAALTPAASLSGMEVVTAGFDGMATQGDALTQKPMRHFPGEFMYGQFAAGGSLLALGGERQTDLLLWDMDRDRPARAALPVAGGAFAFALSPDGRWLACGGRHRRLMIYDLMPRAARPQMLPFAGQLWHAAWSADGKSFAALGTNGASAVWDAAGVRREETWPQVVAIAAPQEHAAGLRKSRAISTSDPSLADMVPECYRRDLAVGTLLSAAISPDGRRLAVGTLQHEIRVIDLTARPETPPRLIAVPRSPHQIAFSHDSTQLAAGLTDGVVLLLDAHDGSERGRWPAHTTPVTALAFLPDGRIASGAEGRGVTISPPGQRLMVPAAVRQLAVSPDGKWLVAGLADATAVLVDTATGQPHGPVLRHQSTTAAAGLLLRFSPDSRLLATGGCNDDVLRLWEIPSGRERAVLYHSNLVDEFTFDATSRRLASLCIEGTTGTLRLWDTESGLPLMPPCPLPAGDGYMSVAFNPDSTRAVVTGWRGAVFLYDLPPPLHAAPSRLADAAEAHAGWRFNDAGLRAPTLAAALYADDEATSRWLAASLEARPLSPYSTQHRAGYLQSLRDLRTVEALQEINQFQPSLNDGLLLRLRQLARPVAR